MTCDKWLVGRRFEFVDMVKLQGEDGPDDVIRAFIWRLRGEAPVAAAGDSTPGVEVVAKELESILYDYMDEDDACSEHRRAATSGSGLHRAGASRRSKIFTISNES